MNYFDRMLLTGAGVIVINDEIVELSDPTTGDLRFWLSLGFTLSIGFCTIRCLIMMFKNK